MKKNNVTEIRNLGMCVCCEICAASCPVSAITMEFEGGQFVPWVDMGTCIDCGLCLSVCPGINIDRNNSGSYKELVGPYIEVYTACTTKADVRKICTSGGIVTTLVSELLKNEGYDAAFLLTYDSFSGNPARLEPCSDAQQAIRAAKSKYIPASVYHVIRALKNNSKKKYIIVGTGCLFQGVKLFIRRKKIPEDNLLFIGLFCNKTLNYNIFDYFEKTYREENEKLTRLDFRNKDPDGWPGDCKLIFDSGRTLVVGRKVRQELKDYFQLNRCLFCLDKLNTSADISVGDCYIKEETDRLGKSSVVIRTEKGKEIFNKCSSLFEKKEEHIGAIAITQKIDETREHVLHIKIFDDRNGTSKEKQDKIGSYTVKNLAKKQRHIKWGEKKRYALIKLHLILNRVTKIAIPANIFINVFFRKKTAKNYKKNVVITGGNLQNKGAQAMVFATVNYLKKTFPDKQIYVFSSRIEEDRETYTFELHPYDLEKKIKVFSKPNLLSLSDEIIKILSDTDFVIDISGYALSSQQLLPTNINYLFNLFIARHFSLPCYCLAQSIGPFNYNPLVKLLLYIPFKFILKYPINIFVRENDGLKHIRKYTRKNVQQSCDIVLQTKKYDVDNIYRKKFERKKQKIPKNSIGIIPNQKVLDRSDKKFLYGLYQSMIEKILQYNKNVYLLLHSKEDIIICKKIKSMFRDNNRVIILEDDMDCIELEEIIRQFDFVVASRYHSIIHAYKNGVPAIILSWAVKYFELAQKFNQLEYFFDIRKLNEPEDVLNKLEKMLGNYSFEKKEITTVLEQAQRETIFNKLFDDC